MRKNLIILAAAIATALAAPVAAKVSVELDCQATITTVTPAFGLDGRLLVTIAPKAIEARCALEGEVGGTVYLVLPTIERPIRFANPDELNKFIKGLDEGGYKDPTRSGS